MKLLLILTAAVVVLASCKSKQNSIKYPFNAPMWTVRIWQLNYPKIVVGMTEQEVINLMGNPLTSQFTYNHIYMNRKSYKNAKITGVTFYYLISQDKEFGSIIDKKIHSINIGFDLNSKVINKSQHYLSKKVFDFSNWHKQPRFDLNK